MASDRIAAARGSHGAAERLAALTRLARRLGTRPAPAGPSRSAALAEFWASDPERRAAAAVEKGEALIAGRRAGRRLLEGCDGLDAQALETRLRTAETEALAALPAGPFAASGFEQGFGPARRRVSALCRGRRAEERRLRALGALRELLADDIAALRDEGAAPEEAAGLLVDRLDLADSLGVGPAELAALGLSIAEEAAVDAALFDALVRTCADLAAGLPAEEAAALAAAARRAAQARALARARAAIAAQDAAAIEHALEAQDPALLTPGFRLYGAEPIDPAALMLAEERYDAERLDGSDAAPDDAPDGSA